MEIIRTNNIARILSTPIEERRLLVELLSARPKGYAHMPAYKYGRWDGHIRLYDKKTDTFPAGLIPYVEASLNQLSISIVDERSPLPTVCEDYYKISEYTLRDYQQSAVKAFLDADGVGTLGMATNAGKTLVASGILKALKFPSMLYVVPSTALLTQTFNDLSLYFPHLLFGRYGAGHHDNTPYLFSTLASLDKVLKFHSPELLIVDECHRGSKSDKLFDLLLSVTARYRVGMSGTPLHYDTLSDMKLAGVCGPVIYQISNKDLIEEGHSTPPLVRFITIPGAIEDDLDWQQAYKQIVVRNIQRNLRIAQLAYQHNQAGLAVMIMTNWVEHAELIRQLIGNDHIYLSGELTASAIADGMEQFRQVGGIMVCTPVLSEGVNIPNIDVLILAAGGKSHIALLQRLGRGMRTSKNKSKLLVYDFIDSSNKYTFSHSKKRYEVYRQQGFQVEVLDE